MRPPFSVFLLCRYRYPAIWDAQRTPHSGRRLLAGRTGSIRAVPRSASAVAQAGCRAYLILTENLDGSSLAKTGTGCLMSPPTTAISSVLGTRWKGETWERVGLGPLTGNLHDPTS